MSIYAVINSVESSDLGIVVQICISNLDSDSGRQKMAYKKGKI